MLFRSIRRLSRICWESPFREHKKIRKGRIIRVRGIKRKRVYHLLFQGKVRLILGNPGREAPMADVGIGSVSFSVR